ncbi:hypothetical protein AURDEDRAFT_124087 [Auricularia subglabra TFB-10046 SS5]|nr:hypothetical protein AURDEDRAFT_124087 [Auricularia subglabra TFB-10046 SS5]
MAGRDPVSELPVELVRHIFSFFTYPQLLAVLGTCRDWRQIAIDCPAYWSELVLDAPREGQAQTFLARLRAAHGRPCMVTSITGGPWDALLSTILPAIASSLHSINLLNLHMHASQCDAALRHLTIPARELMVLQIYIVIDSTGMPLPALPRDALQGQAPCLRTISLVNLAIHQFPPGLFDSVTLLCIGYNIPEVETKVVPDVWSWFPRLRALTLLGGAVIGETIFSESHWASLEWLQVLSTLPALLYAFERTRAQISRIPNVQILPSIASAVGMLIQDIPGDIQLAIHNSQEGDTWIRVVFGDKAWQRSRSFMTLRADWAPDREAPIFGLLSRADFVERIVSLTLPGYLWQSATRTTSPLNHLAELRLILDSDSPVAFAQLAALGNVVCPSLRRFILLVEESEYYVTLCQVRDFTSAALIGWHAPLELQFEGVTFVGYGRYIPEDKTFTYCWTSEKPCMLSSSSMQSDVGNLLPVLAACRSWRQLAIDCPVYWSGTTLSAPTEGEAQTLALRLGRANGRPCSVHTHTPRHCDILSTTILPALESNIPSIAWLNIYVHESQCDELFCLLRMPGWQADALEVCFAVDSLELSLPTLPRDLLQGHAPRLRTIWLENVEIPDPPPAVLEFIVDVGFGYYPPETMIRTAPNLWSCFPRMRLLALAGDTVLGEEMISDSRWGLLGWLRLQVSYTALQRLFEHTPVPISRIPNVHIPCAAVDSIILHVPGPLQVALQIPVDAEANVRVHLGDTAWQRSRAFLTELTDWTDGVEPPSDIFMRLGVTERMVSLTLPDVAWQSATREMLPLPNLTELRLVFDLDGGVGLVQLASLGKVECPALRRLILRVEQGEYYVTLDQVRAFVFQALVAWRAPLELQFEQVTLVGYGRLLPKDNTFTYTWKEKELWEYPEACLERYPVAAASATPRLNSGLCEGDLGNSKSMKVLGSIGAGTECDAK